MRGLLVVLLLDKKSVTLKKNTQLLQTAVAIAGPGQSDGSQTIADLGQSNESAARQEVETALKACKATPKDLEKQRQLQAAVDLFQVYRNRFGSYPGI